MNRWRTEKGRALAEKITFEFLFECLDLDEQTGILRWKVRPDHHFKRGDRDSLGWNRKYAGTQAGTGREDSALQIGFYGKSYLYHRVVYALHHRLSIEEVPEVLDHKDGDRTNNRPSNLRPATVLQNLWNATDKKPASGFKGARIHSQSGLWISEIRAHGTRVLLGYFKTPELAAAAYAGAAKILHGEFYRPPKIVEAAA